MSRVQLSQSVMWLAVCTITILLCGPASCAPSSYASMDHGRLMGELQGDLQSLNIKQDGASSSKSSGSSSPKDYSTYEYDAYAAENHLEMLPPPIVTREPEVIAVGCRSGYLGRGGDCRSSFNTFMFTVTDLAASRKPTPHRMIPSPSLYSLFPSFASTRRRTMTMPSRTMTPPSRPQTQREWLSSYSGFSRGRALLEKRNRNRQAAASKAGMATITISNTKPYSIPSPEIMTKAKLYPVQTSDTIANTQLYPIPTSETITNTKLYPVQTPTKPYDFDLTIPDTED